MSPWIIVLINITMMSSFTLVTWFILILPTFFLALGLSRKLAPKWVGPFLIEWVISSVAYCISLPEEYGYIHPGFHISSLYGHQGPPLSHTTSIFPVTDNSVPEYEIGDILA